MIDYETYCKITKMRQDGLRVSQMAATLGLDERTIAHWMEAGGFRQRQRAKQPSKLDPYKTYIVKWLDTYPYSSVQILQRLRNEGYGGGITILKDYVNTIRPRKAKAFLTLGAIWNSPGRFNRAPVEFFRHGIVLQSYDVRRVYRLGNYGALSGLSSECV